MLMRSEERNHKGGKKLLAQQQEAVSKCDGKRAWIKQKLCADVDLAELYSNATAFICTSLYEGFGIPLVEAMACGCPVIASNTSSIPEVVGDAGLYFDPSSEEELLDALDKIVDDVGLHRKLVGRGLARNKMFNWEKTAKETYNIYRDLL